MLTLHLNKRTDAKRPLVFTQRSKITSDARGHTGLPGLGRAGIDTIVSEGVNAESVVHNLVHHENEIDVLLAPAPP